MTPADLVIHARWLIPVEPDTTVHENHAAVVRDGRILATLPSAEARAQYHAEETIELPGHILVPGFVNAHTHAALCLLRGSAQDSPPVSWPQRRTASAQHRWLNAEFVRDGSELAMASMLRSGTTCFNDAFFFPEATAEAVLRCGLRACLGMVVADFPSPWAGTPHDYLAKGTAMRDRYKDHPQLSFAFAPFAAHTLANDQLGEIRTLADELDVPMHTHLHETAAEIQQSLQQHVQRPLARLAKLGWLTPNFMSVHMTQVENSEIEELARTGTHVAHCPVSNLKLVREICPASELLTAGVNVTLGTDGAANGNGFDMLAEMRSAALLSHRAIGDALPTATILRMATLNGARALGLEHEIGSLVPGKWADMAAVNMHVPECQPLYNPVWQLVYAAERGQISDVWVAGRRLLRHGELASLDLDDILRRARGWQKRFADAHVEPMPT